MNRLILTLPIAAAMLASASAATSGKWVPAAVSSVSASGDNKGFTIIADVELPQPKPCYDVQISRELITIPPYRYHVQERPTGRVCTEVPMPYSARQHFDAQPLPKSVDVYALDLHHKPKHWIVPIIIEGK